MVWGATAIRNRTHTGAERKLSPTFHFSLRPSRVASQANAINESDFSASLHYHTQHREEYKVRFTLGQDFSPYLLLADFVVFFFFCPLIFFFISPPLGSRTVAVMNNPEEKRHCRWDDDSYASLRKMKKPNCWKTLFRNVRSMQPKKKKNRHIEFSHTNSIHSRSKKGNFNFSPLTQNHQQQQWVEKKWLSGGKRREKKKSFLRSAEKIDEFFQYFTRKFSSFDTRCTYLRHLSSCLQFQMNFDALFYNIFTLFHQIFRHFFALRATETFFVC